MVSHLSDIGFNVKDQSEFMQIAQHTFEKGKRVGAYNGSYIKWQLKSGAELWLQLNDQGEVIGMTPGFLGESSRKVSIIYSATGHEGTLDGSFKAWADPVDENPETGQYPFLFESPHFYTVPNFDFPYLTNIQLTAFAEKIECFDIEKEYYKSDIAQLGGKNKEGKPLQFASNSFIPIGSFVSKGKREQAVAKFTGRIIKFEERKNEFTENSFIWMIVDTLGGEIDIVTDPSLLNKKPVVGGYVSGTFWLSGKILKDKKSFFSKLLSKKN
ncbi:MAG TPA: hypothetical protein VLF89_04680 [Candidatus Saccharimonadales bacterium]|nr:hypothetical protein [Candidatus Saccharimonadales bacterium]